MRSTPSVALSGLLLSLFIGGLVGCAPHRTGQTPGDDFKLTIFRWSGGVNARGVVKLENPFGDIRARDADNGQVTFSASIQRFPGDVDDLTMDIDEHDQGINAVVTRTTKRGRSAPFAGRADVTVMIPPGVGFEARNQEGLIDIKGISGPVVAESQRADVVLANSSVVQAETRRGNISMRFSKHAGNDPLRLTTVEGNVHLTVPESAQLTIHAATNGEISMDVASRCTTKIESSRAGKGFVATLGDGTHAVFIESKSGNIEIVGTGR